MTERFPPIHPGEILAEEFLKPMGISQCQLAKSINVSPRRINEIVQGKRAVAVARPGGGGRQLEQHLLALLALVEGRRLGESFQGLGQ